MSRRKRHLLNGSVEVFLKAFDRRGVLIGVLIDDLCCAHLGNIGIRLVEHRTNLWIQLIDDFHPKPFFTMLRLFCTALALLGMLLQILKQNEAEYKRILNGNKETWENVFSQLEETFETNIFV
jgi:hypothetical protein